MSAAGQGLSTSPSGGAIGNDAVETAALFWESTASNQRDEMENLIARFDSLLPAVQESRFTFDDAGVPPGEGGGDGGEGERTSGTSSPRGLYLVVEEGTTPRDLSTWNYNKPVGLVELDKSRMCLAQCRPSGTSSFMACTHVPDDLVPRPSELSGERICTSVKHRDRGGSRGRLVTRLVVDDPIGVFAIRGGVSSDQVKQHFCFSNPLFRLSSLPEILLSREYHRALLDLKAPARVWKFLLEAYPGREVMLEFFRGEGETPRSAEIMTPLPSKPPPGLEEVSQPSGVRSVLQDVTEGPGLYAARARPANLRSALDEEDASDSGSRPSVDDRGYALFASGSQVPRRYTGQRIFAFQAPFAEERITPYDDDLSATSMASSAELRAAIAKVNSLSTTVTRLLQDERERDEALAVTFRRLEGDYARQLADHQTARARLEAEVGSLLERVDELEDALPDLNLNPALRVSDREGTAPRLTDELVAEIAHRVSRSLQFETFAKSQEIEATFLKASELPRYVTEQYLTGLGFVTQSHLTNSLPPPVNLPPRISEVNNRLDQLEKDVVGDGGVVKNLENLIRDMRNRKAGETVNVGSYSFKNTTECEAFLDTLQKPGSSLVELLCNTADMRMQLGMLGDGVFDGAKHISELADAKKAGFPSLEAARMTISFKQVFPANMLKRIETTSGGVRIAKDVFTAEFSSNEVYMGTTQDSPHERFKRVIQQNHDRMKSSIDVEFPPDQPNWAKANMILSWVLSNGRNQAVSFLDSFDPFFKMMHQAGLTESDSWEKCLIFVKAVFTRISEVRGVTHRPTPGSMLYGMLRATSLLQEYVEVDWIRHAEVASALVIAALEKEGHVVKEALAAIKDDVGQIGKNTKEITKLNKKFEELYRKNPTLTK